MWSSSNNNTLDNNNVTANNIGIYMSTCFYNSVTNNNASSNGNTGISMAYNTTMGELPFTIITDEDGYVYQLPAILLGDVDDDGKVFINDYSVFVEFWGLDDND